MPVGPFPDFQTCIATVRKQVKDRKPNISDKEAESQAGAICGRIEKDTQLGVRMTLSMLEKYVDIQLQNIRVIPMILPSSESPKFSKQYTRFIKDSPAEKRRCIDCMHFISDNTSCQIVEGEDINPEDSCDLQRDNYELERVEFIQEDSDEEMEIVEE